MSLIGRARAKLFEPMSLSAFSVDVRGRNVVGEAFVWVVSFPNIAHKQCDRIGKSIYVGDTLVLRLFRRMFAHTLSPSLSVKETVRWMAAPLDFIKELIACGKIAQRLDTSK